MDMLMRAARKRGPWATLDPVSQLGGTSSFTRKQLKANGS